MRLFRGMFAAVRNSWIKAVTAWCCNWRRKPVASFAEKPTVYPGIAVFFQNAFIFFGWVVESSFSRPFQDNENISLILSFSSSGVWCSSLVVQRISGSNELCVSLHVHSYTLCFLYCMRLYASVGIHFIYKLFPFFFLAFRLTCLIYLVCCIKAKS